MLYQQQLCKEREIFFHNPEMNNKGILFVLSSVMHMLKHMDSMVSGHTSRSRLLTGGIFSRRLSSGASRVRRKSSYAVRGIIRRTCSIHVESSADLPGEWYSHGKAHALIYLFIYIEIVFFFNFLLMFWRAEFVFFLILCIFVYAPWYYLLFY